MKKSLLAFIFLSVFTIQVASLFADEEPFSVNAPNIPGEVMRGETFDVSVNINIKPNHFLYQDKLKLEFIPIENFVFGPTILPAAETKYDKFLGKEVEIFKKSVLLKSKVSISPEINPGQHNLELVVYFQGCSDVTCFLPQRKKFSLPIEVLPAKEVLPSKIEKKGAVSAPVNNDLTATDNPFANKSLFGAMVLAFIAGIGISFTPCIYPMIPITVAIIGGQETQQKPFRGFFLTLVYVLGISVVYSALGVAAASTGSLFGSAVNSPWVVGFVATVFIVLAFSMFGVFELKLPTSLAEKFGKKKGVGILGIFFMGLVSGTVASPCVGPILVSLLVYIASTGNKILGFWLLFVFAWGMGLLLIAVGTFSGALKVLPKSGGWMVTIKKILGILLIGAALYYLKAIIPEKIFLITLGIFLITVGIFSGGLDRLVAESAVLLRVKKSFGVLCIIFGIYFLVGTLLLKGLILSPISLIPGTIGEQAVTNKSGGIEWVFSESQGLNIAKGENKPVMIDFWAEWCSVCKKLEKKTLSDPDVIEESERFVNIKIDCTDVDDKNIKGLWKKYGIVGLPTIIFIDKSGAVIQNSTINKYVGPLEFKKIMKEI